MRELTAAEEKTLIMTFKKRFAADIVETIVDRARGEVTHVIKKGAILGVCRALKSEPDFKMNALSDVIGAESGRSDLRFEVIYQLLAMGSRMRLRLKVRVGEGEEVDSVTSVWRSAGWAEREAYDMFGIVFKGHPDLRRIYMPEDFEGFPLRKDYPLRGYKDEFNPNGEER
ncbi:NADH-ubiquinone oxidoreductase chain C [hydrothermal vent metagenome]|uniref:NADH-ubiquinone oxidoreductase chain C n=1 Tax=hydrothermal vent metagenome TaxID=652676 RepID=A0A3B0V7E5_9ZZZZ